MPDPKIGTKITNLAVGYLEAEVRRLRVLNAELRDAAEEGLGMAYNVPGCDDPKCTVCARNKAAIAKTRDQP